MLSGHVIIAGFGLPGRAIAQVLDDNHIPYCVIELNAGTVRRCSQSAVQIITGDVRDPHSLKEAGIEIASMLALAIPDEAAVLEAIPIVRQMNPKIRILARCAFTSSGMKAMQLGAEQVVIAEKVVAAEFTNLLQNHIRATSGAQS